MLNLASTSDLLTLVTSAAGAVQVHASFVDYSNGAVNPSRTNTPTITAAATTTLVGSPALSTVRNVKFLSIINSSSSVANTVSVMHTDGTNNVRLASAVLQPGDSIQFTDLDGWQNYTAAGGLVSFASSAGTVTSAAQPTITSVGTLTSLTVSGNAAAGVMSSQYFYNSSGAAYVGSSGNYGLNFVTNNAVHGSLDTSGNLNITGALTADSSGIGLVINGSAATSNKIQFQESGTTRSYLQATATAALSVVNAGNSANLFTVDQSGNGSFSGGVTSTGAISTNGNITVGGARISFPTSGYIASNDSNWGMVFRPSVAGANADYLFADINGNYLAGLTANGTFTANQFNGSGAGLNGTAASLTAGAANAASGNSFFTAGTGAAGTENDIGVACSGYNAAYLYNNSTAWGLYSGTGGTIISYVRSSGNVTVGAISITSAGNVTMPSFTISSDIRLKSDIQELGETGALLDATKVYEYTKNDRRQYGVIAQEAQDVVPIMVHEGDDGMLGVEMIGYVPLLIAEIKALRARVAALEAA